MRRSLASLVVLLCMAHAEPVKVRHAEGLLHGFLAVRTLEGKTIADGDLVQTAHGDRVTAHLVFRFKDGSLHDENVVFTQRQSFRVASFHLIQKGPSFPAPVDLRVDRDSGRIEVRYQDRGKEKIAVQRGDIPEDLSNGIVPT